MRAQSTLLLIGILLVFVACNNSTDNKTTDSANDLTGRWRLEKEEKRLTKEKGVEYEKQPTYVILNVQKNGYFILYDTFIDPAWKAKGLPLISERSKGQWELKGKSLTLNHETNDTSYTETMEITKISNTTLITKGQNSKSNIYKIYGK